ncbi:LytTR family DNA-binding domain-containing protein [Roseburia hominis]
MIKIAIVDDDKEIRERVYSFAGKAAQKIEPEVEIVCFEGGEEFIDALDQENRWDVLLCDIELPGTNGIEVGRIAKQKCAHLYLIYLTSHSQYAVESYTVDAYQYIMKECMDTRLPEILIPLLEKLEREIRKYTLIGTATKNALVYYRDIISICKEKGQKYVKYNTIDGEYRERNSLDQILHRLNHHDFILVERGIVINIRHVVKVWDDRIFMDDGECIYTSRTRIGKVKQHIHKYWRES